MLSTCQSATVTAQPQYMSVVNDLGGILATVPSGVNYTVEINGSDYPMQDIKFGEGVLFAHLPDEEKETEDMDRVTVPMPTKMIRNGRATVVFFADDTKIVVKLPEGVEDNEYNAFCAAIAKKMFGTNARIKSRMDEIREIVPTEAEKRSALKKAREEAEERRQAQRDAKVRRMANQIVLEKRAKQLAKEMMECA